MIFIYYWGCQTSSGSNVGHSNLLQKSKCTIVAEDWCPLAHTLTIQLSLERQVSQTWSIHTSFITGDKNYNTIIRGPQAKLPYVQISRYFIRCFGNRPYNGDRVRKSVSNTICNPFFLPFGPERSLVLLLVCTICRPFSENRPVAPEFLKLD